MLVVYRKYADGLSRALYILRAEHGSAPTDLRRNVIDHRCVRREHADSVSQEFMHHTDVRC